MQNNEENQSSYTLETYHIDGERKWQPILKTY